MLPLSIRARLTLWYTLAFGALLVVMSLATYGTLSRSTRADADAYLGDVADEVVASLQLALVNVPAPVRGDSAIARWATARTLDNHRFRDIGVSIYRAPRSGTPARTHFQTLADRHERVLVRPVTSRHGTYIVSVSQSTERHEALLRRVREAMFVGIPTSLLLAMGGGFLLVAASLRPVDAMRAQAERIGARTLYERLSVSRPADELSRLSQTFNALLDRVEDAFEQRRRFTADASHELRTPVSIVIGESQLALSADRTPEAYRAALAIIHSEARRLALIVEDLFLLARGDAAEQVLVPVPLYLEELAGDCVDAMQTIAAARQIRLEFLPLSEVPYVGDDAMLRRVVMNLVDNAIKYTPVGGSVRVEAEPMVDGGALLRVRDSGVGIAAEHQARIFERFYRVQQTTPTTGLPDASGAGLGLPIASWIAWAHGGSLVLAASDAHGSVFELRLPTAAAAAPTLS